MIRGQENPALLRPTRSRQLSASILILLAVAAGPLLAQQVPGPDLVVGNLNNFAGLPSCAQFGREGAVGSGTVALGLAPTGCNNGTAPINWFALPNVDHPLISQNMFRLSTVDGSTRFEQIGQAWLKHGFGAAQFDECGFGCTPNPNQSRLGVGCSDPYLASQSANICNLGPRSSIHPYTGVIAGGVWLGAGGGCNAGNFNGNFPSKDHRGHVHTAISHMLQVQENDLSSVLHPGARYFGELQYIVPHEFTEANGNQHNNLTHREYDVTGPNGAGVYTFPELAPAVRESPAVDKWSGATQVMIEPQPGVDGRAFFFHEVTDLGNGTWHYEYAIYNMNLDQSIGSLSIPVPSDSGLSNLGFHAPLNHAPELQADNYSNDAWSVSTVGGEVGWSTDAFAVDPLANAVRFGTLYNFRFDANAPPVQATATVNLFKPGPVSQMQISTLAPAAVDAPPTPLAENFFGQSCGAGPGDPEEDCLNTSFCVPSAGGGFPGTCYVPKNRYLSIDANPLNAGVSTARRVSVVLPAVGTTVLGWMGPPVETPAPGAELVWVSSLQSTSHYRDWSTINATVHLGDCAIRPGDGPAGFEYLIDSIPNGADETSAGSYSPPLRLRTTRGFGDTVGPVIDGVQAGPPDGAANFSDIFAIVQSFQGVGITASMIWTDIAPQQPNQVINFNDIFGAVVGFQAQGAGYPFAQSPCDCPGVCP